MIVLIKAKMMIVNDDTKYTIMFPLPQLDSELEGDPVFEDPLVGFEVGFCKVGGRNVKAEQFKDKKINFYQVKALTNLQLSIKFVHSSFHQAYNIH